MSYHWWDTSAVFSNGVPFAVDALGKWRDVSEVPRGKACDCFCAACHGHLVARQGEVRVHHFAHADRKECRQALEASLYGMAIEILREPNAQLRLPGPYDASSIAYQTGTEVHEAARAITTLKLTPTQTTLALNRPIAAFSRLTEATREAPDITAADQSFSLHILSSNKALYMLEKLPHDSRDVLALNPLVFARSWYDSVCDPDIEENLRAAARAREQFRHWLAESVDGRGWITHREAQRAAGLVKEHVEAARKAYRPPPARPAPAFFTPHPLPSPPRHTPKPVPPEEPDQILRKYADTCRLCSSPMDVVLMGSGLFAGKRLVVCRQNPKHPMRHLG